MSVEQMPPQSIQITVQQLLRAVEPMQRLNSLPFNNKEAYHLKKIGKLMEAELQKREKHRLSIVEEIGVERDTTTQEKLEGYDKDRIKAIQPEQQAEYNRRLKEYDEQTVTLPWKPIPFEMLRNHKITGGDLLELDTLIAEPVEEPPA